MLKYTTSNAPPTIRYLSVCPKNTSQGNNKCNVLLVEPVMIPHSNRERLLKADTYCVTAVVDVREMFELRFEKPVDFAVLNDSLGPFGLKAAAECVRRQWPLAKILVIGCAVPALEDQLYDETISHRNERDGLFDVLRFLAQRSLIVAKGSDPMKTIGRVPISNEGVDSMPVAPKKMLAAG